MSFPKHADYKDSGVGWLGEVPQHWTLTTLRRLVVNTNAGEVIDRTFWGGDAELLYTCAIDPLQCDYEGFPDSKRTLPNDLLLTRNGTPYVHKPVGNSIYTNVVQRITLDEGLDRDFTALAIQNAADNLRGYGVSIESLNYDLWKDLPVGVPPLDEQKAISSFLDVETSKIDGLVSEQRHLIELLKEKRQAVISHAVTKGLNPNAAMKPSGVQWIGDVPQHWEVNRVRYLTQILRGKFTHRPRNDPKMYDGPYPFIQTGEISSMSRFVGEHHQTLSEEGFKVSKQFPSGTLVMTITGAGTANVAILNFVACFPDSIVGFVPADGVSIDYLYNLFIAMREALLSTAVTNTQPNLNIERIGALVAVKPPLDEQAAIVEEIDRASGNYDTLIAEAERAIELLQERRTALISAAVTGKIDVRQFTAQGAK